jgi:hypothetical protein
MYHKIKIKKIQSQPTKEEIEQHMIHYQQQKLQQMEHERELAEARKRDWKAHEAKYYSKLPGHGPAITPKKLDFIDEQRAKEKEEEEAKRARLEKAKEFNSAIKVGGLSSPERHPFPSPHQMEVVGMSSPRRPSREGAEGMGSPDMELKIVVPDSSRRQSVQQQAHQSPAPSARHKQTKSESPLQLQHKASPKVKKVNPKRLISQSSSAVENIGSPYDGKTGPDWVAEVMEMDAEEVVLADVYETGFSMLMVEKGMLSRDPEEDEGELPL